MSDILESYGERQGPLSQGIMCSGYCYRFQCTAFPIGARVRVNCVGAEILLPYCSSLRQTSKHRQTTSTLAAMSGKESNAAAHSQRGWDMFRNWGSPKYFVAPMVDQVC